MATVDQQVINAQLNAKIDIQNTKIEAFIEEMKDFKQEMRDRDNRRADEINALNVKIDEKFERILGQIQNMTIAAVVGVGAIVIGIVSFMKP